MVICVSQIPLPARSDSFVLKQAGKYTGILIAYWKTMPYSPETIRLLVVYQMC